MTVHIIPDEATRALGKLADAELHFTDGPLAGLKLIGFGIWKHQAGNGRNVTFPARHYPEEGERRSYSLLRSMGGDRDAVTRISDLILAAYADHQEEGCCGLPLTPDGHCRVSGEHIRKEQHP